MNTEKIKDIYISQLSSISDLARKREAELNRVTNEVLSLLIEDDQRQKALESRKKHELALPPYPYDEAKARLMPQAQALAKECMDEAIKNQQPKETPDKNVFIAARVDRTKRLLVEGILNKKGSVVISDILRVLLDEFVEDIPLQNKVIIKAKAIAEKEPVELTCPNCGCKASEGKFRADVGSGQGISYPVDLINSIECGNCNTRFVPSEEWKQEQRRLHDLNKIRATPIGEVI